MTEKVKNTIENLKRNNMEAFYAKDEKEAVSLLSKYIFKGAKVALGGSVTLKECNVPELLKTAEVNYLDRAKGDTPEKAKEIMRSAFFADLYISSANAITEKGEIYNVDGNGNRVAAIGYGPDKVVLIVGKNKIVPDISAAIKRVKTVAAPKNTARLSCNTYCNLKGVCKDIENQTGGCLSDERICCNYQVLGFQRAKGRITVIITEKDMGF